MRVRDITARAKVTGRQRGSVIFFLCWDLVPALNWTTSVMSSCRGRWCRDITDVEERAGEQEGGEGGRTGSLVSPVSQVINNSSTNGISLSRRHPEAQSRPFTLFTVSPLLHARSHTLLCSIVHSICPMIVWWSTISDTNSVPSVLNQSL